MNYILPILLLVVAFSCKKEKPDGPVNSDFNNVGLDCETCPAQRLFVDQTTSISVVCDDFANVDSWPTSTFESGEIIGYTQEGVYPVTFTEGDFAAVNFGTIGIGGVGLFEFEMSGENQSAEFEITGLTEDFSEMYVQVNGSATISVIDDFPITAPGGVTVVIDSITATGDIYYARVLLDGPVENVTFYLFETSVATLCVTKTIEDPPVVNELDYVKFDTFYGYGGTETGTFPVAKTPLGHYGYEGANLSIDFDSFLGYSPTQIGFVHAFPSGSSNLVNVQLPGTPLIVTVPDSLDDYLTPYGYQVAHYTDDDGVLWLDNTNTFEGVFVDSIIIKGNNMDKVTLGANLQESELRSVCTYYEQ